MLVHEACLLSHADRIDLLGSPAVSLAQHGELISRIKRTMTMQTSSSCAKQVSHLDPLSYREVGGDRPGGSMTQEARHSTRKTRSAVAYATYFASTQCSPTKETI
jgi:hypothetical protein